MSLPKPARNFVLLPIRGATPRPRNGKLILTVLAGLAEFERSLIIARTQAGIARAKARGVTFGRPAKLNPRQRRMIAARYAKGETMATLAAEFGVGEATVWRALRGEPAA